MFSSGLRLGVSRVRLLASWGLGHWAYIPTQGACIELTRTDALRPLGAREPHPPRDSRGSSPGGRGHAGGA